MQTRARINKRGQAVGPRAKTGRNQITAPIFMRVPQVKLPKRLDLDQDADWAFDSIPKLIVANFVGGRFSKRLRLITFPNSSLLA